MLELPRYFSYSFLARLPIGMINEPHSFFRGFSTNMLPYEILECCNEDTEKALEKWNQMYDLNSVIRLDMVQYNNIRNNIQFLSYKMGETPEESIIHAGLEKDLWNVILNHYPQISILQIKALAIYFQTTIKILVNTFMLSGLNKKLKILREEKIPNKLQFIVVSGLSSSTVMEIEDGMFEPDLSIFLSYVNAIGIDGRQLIDWEKHTNVYNHLESLTPAEAEILSKYRNLNIEGQKRITEYADDLVAGGRFAK